MSEMTTPPVRQTADATLNAVPTPCIDSRELMRGGRLIEILHAGQRYTLRLTRENKLILTK